ncbi:hypothetical protein K8I61_15930 [bacterium]|nr:hypothetical protein [bacterium]
MPDAPRANNAVRPEFVAALCVAAIFIAMNWQATRFASNEDAFISYRHAANLVNGHGLVFNAGERVEGITNLAWTLFLAGLYAIFGAKLPQVVPIVQIVLGLGVLWVAWQWTRNIVPVFVLAVLPGFVDTTGWGLETVLVALCAIVTAWRLFECNDGVIAGIAAALHFATRPDALAFNLLLFAIAWYAGVNRRSILVAAAISFAGVAGVEIFRLAYYGNALPNTYYAKAGGPAVIAQGFAQLWEIARWGGWPLPLLVILAATRKGDRVAKGVAIATLVWGAYYVWVGGSTGNPMRLFTPWIVLLAAVALRKLPPWWRGADRSLALAAPTSQAPTSEPARRGGADRSLALAAPTSRAPTSQPTPGRGSPRVAGAVAIGLAALACFDASFTHATNRSAPFRPKLVSMAVAVLPEEMIVAVGAVGEIGWENLDRRIFDPLGIVTASVAHDGERKPSERPGHRVWATTPLVLAGGVDAYFPIAAGAAQDKCDTAGFDWNRVRLVGVDAALAGDPAFRAAFEPAVVDLGGGICVGVFRKAGTSEPPP